MVLLRVTILFKIIIMTTYFHLRIPSEGNCHRGMTVGLEGWARFLVSDHRDRRIRIRLQTRS